MVPEGWEKRPLGEVCASVVDCVNKTAPVVPYETPYRMIRTSNVRDGKLSMEGLRYVEADTFETWTRRGRLQDNDVILTREAPVGEIGIVKNSDGLFLGQRTMLYRADPDKLDQLFLYQSMMGRYLQSQFLEHTIGGTVGHIKVPDCSAFHILLPPLPEQKKIAEILSTWDRAIGVAERQLETARLQKKALMQQLLTGTRRLPGFDGEWKTVKLGDECSLLSGPAFESSGFSSAGIKLLRGSNVKRGVVDWGRNITAHWPNDLGVEKYHILANDIAIAMDGYVGNSHVFFEEVPSEGCLLVQRVCRLRAKSKINPVFLYESINSHRFWVHCQRRKTATAIAHITMNDIRDFEIDLPTIEEQNAIASVLSVASREFRQLSNTLAHLRTEKRALMQQLLTGKKRVTV